MRATRRDAARRGTTRRDATTAAAAAKGERGRKPQRHARGGYALIYRRGITLSRGVYFTVTALFITDEYLDDGFDSSRVLRPFLSAPPPPLFPPPPPRKESFNFSIHPRYNSTSNRSMRLVLKAVSGDLDKAKRETEIAIIR